MKGVSLTAYPFFSSRVIKFVKMQTNQKLLLGGLVALFVVAVVAVVLSYKSKQADLKMQQENPDGYYHQENQITMQDAILGGSKAFFDWLKSRKKTGAVMAPNGNTGVVGPGVGFDGSVYTHDNSIAYT